MSQLWKEICRRKASVLRAQDMNQSAPEIRNGRDAATTLPVRRKSQPQDHKHEHHEVRGHNKYAVQPPTDDDRILYQYHNSDTKTSSEAANEEHTIPDHYVPRNLGFSNETEIESVGLTSDLDIENPFQNLTNDIHRRIRERHDIEDAYSAILLIRPECKDVFEQDLQSLHNFVHTNVPHPLEYYSARRSLAPNGTLNWSPMSMFIHTFCRQQGLFRPWTIRTPGGRLALVPRGKTWADRYTKETGSSLKSLKSPRAKRPGSGETNNVIWLRWTAIYMARTYALWFSRSSWWQGDIGAATFDGAAISD
ncbi:hypothetical protein BDZ45DRAFT_735682 [Acephala macrosclerotiorum]|nr:hypothetical protein BDZ45DRAFT_735682 [Acephala macrosclerotiorum]